MPYLSDPQKALLIVNPVSGKRTIVRTLPDVIRILMDAGFLVTTAVTAESGDATAFAEHFGADYDLIVCAGGDGTLNETVTGLVKKGISVPVGYIPCGSTNDFAVSRGISLNINEAAADAATGRQVSYDIGRFGDRYFTYVAAFGAFTSLSYNTDQNLKNMVGHAAYLMGGLIELSMIHPIPLKITADGTVFEGEYAFGAVCNTTSIAGTISLPDPDIDLSDGQLELMLLHMPQDLIEFEEIVQGLLTQDYSSPLIEFTHARSITVESNEELEWSLDGEGSGKYTSVTISVLPGFLQMRQ